MQKTQQAAARAVRSVLAGHNLDTALASQLRQPGLTDQERSQIRAYSYGTLRHLGLLRYLLDTLVTRTPKHPDVMPLLLVALYQLEYGKAPHFAVVDHAVNSVGSVAGQALKPFVNAVLRQYLRRREELLRSARREDVARLSYPRWWIDKLRKQLGGEADRILELGNLHPPMTLRVNRRRIDPGQYLSMLAQQQIAARAVGPSAILLEAPIGVECLPGFEQGLVSVQDAGAQRSACLLDLHSGQTVVDACAAPGGKAGHILELADVRLTALDRDAERLARVGENLQRLGLQARLQCADAANLESWWDGTPVDRVLLDAPCSASGVVRRHPDVKWLRREGDVAGFANQQSRLLDALWQVVAGGGKLLYVTCSIFREENQDQVRQFLSRHADALLVSRHLTSGGDLLLPSEEHDGFFHALFEKT